MSTNRHCFSPHAVDALELELDAALEPTAVVFLPLSAVPDLLVGNRLLNANSLTRIET